jgi:hypothetical protein
MKNQPPAFDNLAQCWVDYAQKMSDGIQPEDNSDFVAWLELDWLVGDDPEQAWSVILQVLSLTDSPEILAQLAAGPLEDLLSKHGDIFIERVELLAKSDARFAFLLGGVWKFMMTDEIWERVGRVANRTEWK